MLSAEMKRTVSISSLHVNLQQPQQQEEEEETHKLDRDRKTAGGAGEEEEMLVSRRQSLQALFSFVYQQEEI